MSPMTATYKVVGLAEPPSKVAEKGDGRAQGGHIPRPGPTLVQSVPRKRRRRTGL